MKLKWTMLRSLSVLLSSAPVVLNSFFCSHAKDNSFYSSSDSEDEDEPRKFHVEIKPVQPNNGTHQNRATIDELKASIGNIILSPSSSVRLHDVHHILPQLPKHKPVAVLLCSLLWLSTLEGDRRMSKPSFRCLPLVTLTWSLFYLTWKAI